MLRVRRPVKPSRFSILVILFLPRNRDRRLAEMGKFSIVCKVGRKGENQDGLLRRHRRRRAVPKTTVTHANAVPSVFEVGEAGSIPDAFDLGELVLDQVEVGQVRVVVG